MATDDPFRPGSPLSEFLRRQREQAEMIKRVLGPTYELQQRIKTLQRPLADLPDLTRIGIVANVTNLQGAGALGSLHAATKYHRDTVKALEAFASPAWMQALQKTAVDVNRDDFGMLRTQKLLATSAVSDLSSLARTFDANRSLIATIIAATKWTEQFRTFGDRIAPSLAVIKIAAERARMLDAATLRASANAVARSAAAVASEQVLEAHRLLEAISQSESPEQSANLLAALISLMAALFSRFGENTLRELREIGAIKLIELFMLAVAIIQFSAPAGMSAEQKKSAAELQAEAESLQDKLEKILAANEAADEAYVSGLQHAELKRAAAIRCEPRGEARVLMRGEKGMLFAIKESRGKWRLAVYRDPLTDQLSEGWIYNSAIEALDHSPNR